LSISGRYRLDPVDTNRIVFNIFNHPQFDNPKSAPNFGQIVNTSVNPRVIQFALKFMF